MEQEPKIEKKEVNIEEVELERLQKNEQKLIALQKIEDLDEKISKDKKTLIFSQIKDIALEMGQYAAALGSGASMYKDYIEGTLTTPEAVAATAVIGIGLKLVSQLRKDMKRKFRTYSNPTAEGLEKLERERGYL